MTRVLASYGKEVPMREVREIMASGGAGCHQILAAAYWYGLRTRAVRVTRQTSTVSRRDRSSTGSSITSWSSNGRPPMERGWSIPPQAGGWSPGASCAPHSPASPSRSSRQLASPRRSAAAVEWAVTSSNSCASPRRWAGCSERRSCCRRWRWRCRFSPGWSSTRGAALGRRVCWDARAGPRRHRAFHFRPRWRARGCCAPACSSTRDDARPFSTPRRSAVLVLQQRSAGDLMERMNSNATVREIPRPARCRARSTACCQPLPDHVMVVHPILGMIVLGLGALRRAPVFRPAPTAPGIDLPLVQVGRPRAAIRWNCSRESRASNRWERSGGCGARSNLFADELNVALPRGRLNAIFRLGAGGAATASPFVILVYGALEVVRGDLTLGTMLAVSALAAGFFAPFPRWSPPRCRCDAGELLRVASTTSWTLRPSSRAARRWRGAAGGRITLDSVSFRYNARRASAWSTTSARHPAGSFVALVGPSGAARARWRICWSDCTGR